MRKCIILGLTAAACLALAACGTTQTGQLNSAVSDVVNFTDADLDNAEAIAVQNHDTLAVPCFPALKAWVHTLPGANGVVQVSGLASGFEAGRVTVNGISQGVPDAVYQACGPLYMQAHGQLLKAIGGGALLH